MDLNEKICYLCTKNVNTYKDFTTNDYDDMRYIDKYHLLFTDLALPNDNNLLAVICLSCSYKLREAYDFKKQCICAITFWQEHFQNNTVENKTDIGLIELVKTEDFVKYDNNSDTNDNDFLESELDAAEQIKEENDYCNNIDRKLEFNELESKIKVDNNVIETTKSRLRLRRITRNNKKIVNNNKAQRTKKSNLNKIIDVPLYTSNELENIYLCKKCNKKFSNKRSLKKHIDRHEGNQKYLCNICGNTFSAPSDLKKHMLKHTTEHPFPCALCPKAFKEQKALDTHMMYHTNDRRHMCEVCGKKFVRNGSLKTHMLSHDNEKKYACTVCEKRFNVQSSLRIHMNRHKNVTFECEKCGLTFLTMAGLYRHNKIIHIGVKSVKCEMCDRMFYFRNLMKAHMLKAHTNERPFACTLCTKRFSTKEVLNQHMNIHTGEKKYECKVCGKCFAQSGTLSVHMRLHTGERPYKCQLCEKAFIKSHHLNNHMERHHNKSK